MKRVTRHLNPATIMAFAAMIFAMSGGAYALNSSGKVGPAVAAHAAKKAKGKSTTRAKRGARGERGKQGPAGPEGKPGPAGPVGPAGPRGATGTTGATGANGAAGPAGEEGPAGKDGSPWTVGGTLPAGATETGAWSLGNISAAAAPNPGPDGVIVPISFPVPLEEPLGEGHVHYINTQGKELELGENASFEFELTAVAQPNPAPCPGSAEFPEAEPGQLCVYEGDLYGAAHLANQMIGNPAGVQASVSDELEGTSKGGAILNALVFEAAKGDSFGWGTWAVSAPEL